MRLQEMSAAQVRRALAVFAVDLGAAHYCRKHPGCEPDEALAWAVAYRGRFADDALTVMAAVVLAGEKEGGQSVAPAPATPPPSS